MIHIYTGNGKGKTTASLGLALRAVGAGKKAAIIQFMKKGDSSEIKTIKKYHLPIAIFSFGIGFYKILGDRHTKAEHRKAAGKAWQKAQEIINSQNHDLIILDEINVAIVSGLIDVDDVLTILNAKRSTLNAEIILTGRSAHPKLVKMADLVTAMKCRKHYFDKGIKARKGIEY